MCNSGKIKAIISLFTLLMLIAYATKPAHTFDVRDIVGLGPSKPIQEADRIYNDGLSALYRHNYKKAEKQFKDLMVTYPFSSIAMKGEVMLGYNYFKNKDYENSIQVLENFMQNYPPNEYSAYVYYLNALNYYQQMAIYKRDVTYVKKAATKMQQTIAALSVNESAYINDLDERLWLAKTFLAESNYNIGKFYYKNHQYNAALKRFLSVLKEHQTTAYAPASLRMIIKCCEHLGNEKLTDQYRQLYYYNYEDSDSIIYPRPTAYKLLRQ